MSLENINIKEQELNKYVSLLSDYNKIIKTNINYETMNQITLMIEDVINKKLVCEQELKDIKTQYYNDKIYQIKQALLLIKDMELNEIEFILNEVKKSCECELNNL